MLDLTALMVFLAATLALNVTPGPDMLYVVARSVSEGRKAGIVSALGISAGCLVHTFAIAAGLSGLLMAVPLAFEVVKFTGAAYLLYLGVRALISRDTPLAAPTVERARLWAIFRQGVVTNVLNPKVALFFLAFLPQFVDPKRGPVAAQLVLLGFLFNVSGTLVNGGGARVERGRSVDEAPPGCVLLLQARHGARLRGARAAARPARAEVAPTLPYSRLRASPSRGLGHCAPDDMCALRVAGWMREVSASQHVRDMRMA